MSNPKKLKRIVLKEELVELTQDYKIALVLQQLIYWSERVNDFDKFLEEEEIIATNTNQELPNTKKRYGWIYKTAEELSEETLMFVSKVQMHRYLTVLEDKKWIEKRRNPNYKWDKTFQYRININKIQIDLFELGYALDGYKIIEKTLKQKCNFEVTRCNTEDNKMLLRRSQDVTAIPETTSETTIQKDITKVICKPFPPEKSRRRKRKSSMREKINKRTNEKVNGKTKNSSNKKVKYETNDNLQLLNMWNRQPNLKTHKIKDPPTKTYKEALYMLHHMRSGTLYKIISKDQIKNGTDYDLLKKTWTKTEIGKGIKALNEMCLEGNWPPDKTFIKQTSLANAIFNPRTGTTILMNAYLRGVQPMYDPKEKLKTNEEQKAYDLLIDFFNMKLNKSDKRVKEQCIEIVQSLSGQREQHQYAWKRYHEDVTGNPQEAQNENVTRVIYDYIQFLVGGSKFPHNEFELKSSLTPAGMRIGGYIWKLFEKEFDDTYSAHPLTGLK